MNTPTNRSPADLLHRIAEAMAELSNHCADDDLSPIGLQIVTSGRDAMDELDRALVALAAQPAPLTAPALESVREWLEGDIEHAEQNEGQTSFGLDTLRARLAGLDTLSSNKPL